jgi:organic radical activating enzyme
LEKFSVPSSVLRYHFILHLANMDETKGTTVANTQPISPRYVSPGTSLFVHSIFLTIQGEGPFVGRRALFVRLGGCNLQCPGCDTEYTEDAYWTEYDNIVQSACDVFAPDFDGLVVITGGEPFRQNIALLCNDLIANGIQVQVETNGKLEPQDPLLIARMIENKDLHIVVAPKTATVHKFFYTPGYAAAWKFVVSNGAIDETDGLPTTALAHPMKKGQRVARPAATYECDIYIQPFDCGDHSGNQRHLAEAVRCVTDFPGRRRISLQVHKLLGME